MGIYVNLGNRAFAEIADADYVDKTGLAELINRRISRRNKLVCVSRPRRFGKSYAVRMLTAFYDCSCDSYGLFRDMAIAGSGDYREYMNSYNVISIDITAFTSDIKKHNGSMKDIPAMIEGAIWRDLSAMGFAPPAGCSLNDFLIHCTERQDGKPFIFLIDEWDAVIREAKRDKEAQDAYLNLLRGWFKNGNFTPRVVAAAYMTGILPIRKDGTQSAISDFDEYTMLHPGEFVEYAGFTEEEARRLCVKNGMDFEELRSWYDGYTLSGRNGIYNPYSLMRACSEGVCRSFWGKTSAQEALTDYISLDFDGLQETVAGLIIGEEALVNTSRFQNDLESFRTRDDVLALLVILNTSRGGLIDAEALLNGIRQRKIGAACLDVYEEEADIFFEDRSGHILNDELLSRLISMPNVIVTSHQAFLTEEALNNIAETTVDNICSYFTNDGICNNELCYRCGKIEECRRERKERCF